MRYLLITLLLLSISIANVEQIPQDGANHALISAIEYKVLTPIIGTQNAVIATIGTGVIKELVDASNGGNFSFVDIVYDLFGLGLVSMEWRF